MARRKPRDPKQDALREHGALNPRAERVSDPLFAEHEFFDARDLVQVKYELLRRVRVDGHPVGEAASAFGLSRPSFYQAQAAFEAGGLPGLLPRKRGPRGRHKLTEEVMAFVLAERAEDERQSFSELARRIEERFGLRIHPRSVERALAEEKKKRR
jgi:transposase